MTRDEQLQMFLEYIETNVHERRYVRWAIEWPLAQPPQRPWVGLTDEERDRFVYIDEKDKKRFRKYGAEIEQLLKDKNNG